MPDVARSWDISGENPNGVGLYKALTDLELYLLNSGELTRYGEQPGDLDTVIDLALASEHIREKSEWKLGPHMGSDHRLCEVRIIYSLTLLRAEKRKSPYHGTREVGMWHTL